MQGAMYIYVHLSVKLWFSAPQNFLFKSVCLDEKFTNLNGNVIPDIERTKQNSGKKP